MAASHPRPDPSSPASVAEATFATTRRGYSQDEVRAFLTSVAAEIGRLQERSRQLEAQARDAKSSAPAPVVLDEETAAELLGEETLRVLQTARESSSQIKIRAEETAARVLREANDEANRVRQDAEIEAARQRQDSAADADAEVAHAKQEGREMVTEARAYRERVLADLDRRTKLARQQIEELIQGRGRLLQVFERARLVAVDVTSGLAAIDSPDELVNLTPTTGPVPVMVPAQRADELETQFEAVTAGVPGKPFDIAAEDDDLDDHRAVVDDAASDDLVVGETDDEIHGAGVDDIAEASDVEAPAVDAPVGEEDDDDDDDDDHEDVESGAKPVDGNVVALFPDRRADTPSDEIDDDLDDARAVAAKPDVDGIFERLRDEASDQISDEVAADEPPDEHIDDEQMPTAFSRRDERLTPLIVGAARKLKRVLADEQNGALDTLRQKAPVTSLDMLLGEIDEHAASHVDAIGDELLGAAAGGAAELGANDTKTLRRKLASAGATSDASALLRSDLILPLRERLARAITDGSGDNDQITKRVRAVYREWKTQHIDDQLDDVFRYAYGGGMTVLVEPGREMVWTIDPDEASCPDCEDNSLAGPVAAGDEYPTGQTSAPAHPGCRCLTLPVAE